MNTFLCKQEWTCEKLISQFKAENKIKLDNPDSSIKVEIIIQLEQMMDEKILSFFIQVLQDEKEYDLARIEILKIL